MTLRHMEIFYALCQNDYNTTKAAHALNMTQPAVSLAIKELETYYDVLLFDRIGRKLIITQAGKRFEEYTKSIEGLFSDMENEMKNWDKQGIIRVGATYTISTKFLPQYAKAFKQKTENKNIEIRGMCAPAYVLEKKLLNNELDFAFSEGVCAHPSIVSEPYMDDELIVFAANDGKYPHGQKLTLEEFANSRFVVREAESGTRKIFDRACEKAGFSVNPVWESMCNAGIMSAVGNGMGIGVLSSHLVREGVKHGWVVPLEVEGVDLNRKFYIIRHRDKKLSAAAENFIEVCRQTKIEESYHAER